MQNRHMLAAFGLGVLLIGSPRLSQAQREPFIVESSAAALSAMMQDPNVGPPPELIRQAQGLIIFPKLVQGGFLIGANHGRGIVVMRDEAGGWTNPFFIKATGGNVGFLAGAQANEVVIVFRNKQTIERFLLGRGKLTMGVDASVAAGPLGAGVGADTDPRLNADLLTFSRNRGLYAGAAFGGVVNRVDSRANWSFYGMSVSPPEIINGVEGLAIPPSVARLHQVLDLYTRRGTPPDQLVPSGGRTPRSPGDVIIDGGEPIIESPGAIPGFDEEFPTSSE